MGVWSFSLSDPSDTLAAASASDRAANSTTNHWQDMDPDAGKSGLALVAFIFQHYQRRWYRPPAPVQALMPGDTCSESLPSQKRGA